MGPLDSTNLPLYNNLLCSNVNHGYELGSSMSSCLILHKYGSTSTCWVMVGISNKVGIMRVKRLGSWPTLERPSVALFSRTNLYWISKSKPCSFVIHFRYSSLTNCCSSKNFKLLWSIHTINMRPTHSATTSVKQTQLPLTHIHK